MTTPTHHYEIRPSFGLSIATLGLVVGVISIGLLVFEADLHMLMFIALGIALSAALFSLATGRTAPRIGRPKDFDGPSIMSIETLHTFEDAAVDKAVADGKVEESQAETHDSSANVTPSKIVVAIFDAIWYAIWRARTALVIFVLIGVLIAALIQSGTVATLIYWGILLIHPGWFLPAGLLLCSLMSIATGTAWGTVGTAGVVLMGIGAAMEIPLPIVAGVVVCGATFGDKMSPVSDTTNLASMAARTNLYHHIRSMTYTTAPTYLLTLILFTLVGSRYAGNKLPAEQLQQMEDAIGSVYSVGWVTMLPLIVLIVMSVARIRAIWTMLSASIIAVIIALGVQGADWANVLAALWHGDYVTTSIESLTDLFSRGGVTSMWFTMALSLQALALGGLLSDFGFMRSVLRGLLLRVKRVGSLITSTIACALMGNLGMGEAYMSIVLGGQLFSEAYDDAHLDRGVLSRCLEEGATLTTPLIPWTTAGVFFSQTLGISTVEYLPFAWMNILNPLVGILFGYLGWGLFTSQRNVKHSDNKIHTS